MKAFFKGLVFILIVAPCVFAQDTDAWPSLSYLRSDYKSVTVVAHVRIKEAGITGRVGGYENWKVNAVVVESFKGKSSGGDT